MMCSHGMVRCTGGPLPSADIIALLIVGVVLVVLFVLWERFLENTRVWIRTMHLANGVEHPAHAGVDLAVGKGMLIIVFFEWCSLHSITFSIQVCMFISSSCAILPTRCARSSYTY